MLNCLLDYLKLSLLSNKIRLNRYLAECGVAARRKADELIEAGEIKLNGELVTELGTKIDPLLDEVKYAGGLVVPAKKIYIVLNKPAGYVTACEDEHAEKLVIDLIDVPERIFPVGRLDKDATGLLLLTNDGKLAHRLMHPSFEHEKIYEVSLRDEISVENLKKLEGGVELEEGLTAPAFLRRLSAKKIELTIHEGRKRQVKRMLEAVGNKVVTLKRTKFAGLELGRLKVSEWKYLKEEEIDKLINY